MKILGEEINFEENLAYSLRRYRVWWLILLVTIVFDYITTLYFVEKYSVNKEANYVIRLLIENLGIVTGALIGKLLQLISVVVIVSLNRRLGNIFLLLVILLNIWAVVLNSLI